MEGCWEGNVVFGAAVLRKSLVKVTKTKFRQQNDFYNIGSMDPPREYR